MSDMKNYTDKLGTVCKYNIKSKTFPSRIVGQILGEL